MIRGNLTIKYMDGVTERTIARLVNAQISVSSEVLPAANPDKYSAAYGISGMIGWSASASLLQLVSAGSRDASQGRLEVIALARTLVLITLETDYDQTYTGSAYVSQFDVQAQIGNAMSGSFTLTGEGELVSSAEALNAPDYIYVTAGTSIFRIPYYFEEGQTFTTYVDSLASDVEGIAIDPADNAKYVCSQSAAKIYKATGEIGSVSVSDWKTGETNILFCKISGTDLWWSREVANGLLRKAPISTPASASTIITMAGNEAPRNFAIGDFIYLGLQDFDHFLYRYALNGTGGVEIIQTGGVTRAVALDTDNGRIYWGEDNGGEINHTPLDLSGGSTAFATITTGLNVRDIYAIPEIGEVVVIGSHSANPAKVEIYSTGGTLKRSSAAAGPFQGGALQYGEDQ